ncbi:LOW QUALITY PROTEIN: major latex protein 149-like [Momordica charantia]|uniref:LOW QUALITY PROTEIN: major latex protein 149-like n=1 Tax=Momordica charantia TaxID=3673 RepID=A0A6J1CQE9_MOMCH|nr:LOW QUALITY PROTEIN: major latex protein 149-like [Momordica charantia]
MAQISIISEQVQLKCSGLKFYETYIKKIGSLHQMFPENLKSYEIVEGNGFTNGIISHWKYDFGSLTEAKLRLVMDEPNKSITLEFLEGDLFRDFEVFKVKVEVSDGGSHGMSSVKWCVEFVKTNEDVPPPHNYLQFGLKLCKALDAYISKKVMSLCESCLKVKST